MLEKLIDFIRSLFAKPVKKAAPPIEKKEITTPDPVKVDLIQIEHAVLNIGADRDKFELLLKEFHKLKDEYEVNTFLRKAHFWAQMAHETGGFRWYGELGGKSYFQRYEGRKDLGNTRKGDGYKYRGRGIIHLTGRYNYTKYSKKLGIDLVNNPDRAKDPDVAMLVALEYWKTRKINKYADKDDVRMVTRRINGGYNGLADRKRYLEKLKKALK